MSRNFKEVGNGNGNVWNPTIDADGVDITEPGADAFLEGYYTNKKDDVGKFSKSVIEVTTEEDVKYDVWLNTVLEGKFAEVRIGQFVRITYLGWQLKKGMETKNPKTLKSTDYYKNWSVEVDADAEPLQVHSAAPAKAATAPAASNGTGSNPGAPPKPKVPSAPESDLPFFKPSFDLAAKERKRD